MANPQSHLALHSAHLSLSAILLLLPHVQEIEQVVLSSSTISDCHPDVFFVLYLKGKVFSISFERPEVSP